MAWIESHQELRNHPKTKRLARKLGISVAAAVGHLHLFWWWSMDYAEDGDLSRFDPEDIADAAGWEGDPSAFLEAMIDCGPGDAAGFIEHDGDRLVVHDWQEYIGRLIEKKVQNRERKAKSRGVTRQKSDSRGQPGDNARKSRESHADVTRDSRVTSPSVTQESQGYQTIPNQTIPNITKPSPPTPPPEGAGGFEQLEQVEPTLRQVVGLWNDILAPLGFPRVAKGSPQRESRFAKRLSDDTRRQSLLWWETLFRFMSLSDFLRDNAKKNARWLTFDWVLDESNLVKIAEGKYSNAEPEQGSGDDCAWEIAEEEASPP